MEEENTQQQQTTTEEDLTSQETLIKELQELQKTTVSKEKYDKDVKKLTDEKNLYLKAITEGKSVDTPTSEEKTLKEMAVEQSKFKGTNLDYWKQTVPYIDKILKEMPKKEIIKLTGADGFDQLVKIKNVMGKMVKDSNGDAGYFRTLYGDRIIDSAPDISSEISQAGGLVNYFVEKNRK